MNKAVAESTNSGFSGTGYANFDNEAGSGLEIPVYVSTEGEKEIIITYANGSTTAREVIISVNDTESVKTVAFDVTASWTAWTAKTLVFPLRKGINVIKLTSISADGGPNIDNLVIDYNSSVANRILRDQAVRIDLGKSAIYFNSPNASVNVDLFSMDGRVVFSRSMQLRSGISSVSLPIKDLNNGNYIIKTSVNGKSWVKRFTLIK